MSSRPDYRRRERSPVRDRDRGQFDRFRDARRSRSRSPPLRRGERDRRDYDRRNHGHDREDNRRDRDRRDDRRRDDRDRRDRDNRREPPAQEREGDRVRERDAKAGDRPHDRDGRHDDKRNTADAGVGGSHTTPLPRDTLDTRSRQTSEIPTEDGEEGEAMEATNDDDTGMMAMMGLSGFGSTKGKHVEGNQEGGVQVKKMRTWRQYMNRRGGFNRPLDKIK
ncbi:hypothetical protein DAEQUDRAFT_379949 [Daedalea quercina L-15889]|uniref:U4/U6.U5 small nuclear ribonucleoprotein 27kDa protein domain-containing protein n=1 Tax=Daedalea quercina L-15889 TaxID=1314783 RepID=A0A165P4W0_9APHY|nr:hypothetical protein DAEQUDRAFT_379949 [Daedalea quercina L-15889]